MKYSKSLRKLMAALTLALLVATTAAPPALAATNIFTQPTQGTIGDSIEVYGYGFTPSYSIDIYFSSQKAAVNDFIDVAVTTYKLVQHVNTDNQGQFDTYFILPDSLTDGNDQEKVHNGTYYVYTTYFVGKGIRAVATFTVVNVSAISLSQKNGAVGSRVTIAGNGFGSRESITIKYDGNKVFIESGDNITATDGRFQSTLIIPRSIVGKHTITAFGDSSGFSAKDEFTVNPAMTVRPTSGKAGDTITVTGTGFSPSVGVSVTFDNVEVTTTETTNANGSFELTFGALPRGAGSFYIEATDDNGNSERSQFTLAPAALNLSSSIGYVGSQVTISGTGFKANSSLTIIFDNDLVKSISTDSYGRFNTSFNVPFRNTGIYKVKVTDSVNVVETNFSVGTSASINPVTSAAAPGYVGTGVTISGVGFTVGGIVTITYDGNGVALTTVNTSGLFSTMFKIPPSSHGAHKIKATDGANNQEFTFIMESIPPPTPAPLKPEMGAKTNPGVFFDWEDVTDPSGVTYTIQIATEKNFSTGSIVLEKTGITKSEYTLTGGERLKSVSEETPYYWHVKAVDDAYNESLWSGTGSFYVAFAFDTQQLMYIILGIVAVILALLGFWLGMKRARPKAPPAGNPE